MCVLSARPRRGRELFECGRKLCIVGLPVFFQPGSSEQLTFGLLICFLTITMFAKFSPSRDPNDDMVQLACLAEVFIALLATIVLHYEIAFSESVVTPSHLSKPERRTSVMSVQPSSRDR